MSQDIASFVIDKLADPILKEASFLYNVAGKVDSVKNQLEYIKSFLESVETRRTEDKTVRLWMDQLREVSFRIEDAIDKFLIEVQGDRTTVTQKSCDLFSSVRWIYRILMKPVALHNLGVELSDIKATLNEIDENRQRFNINDLGGGNSQDELSIKRRSLEYPDYEIIGLENEKKTIVKKLLSPQAQNLHVISIVGTGGLGKTTLARKVFRSTEVRENFDVRIWLSVSKEYNMINILRKMLNKIRTVEQKEKDEDVEYLVDQISSLLKKKKFLIVLDDVWSETFWRDIRMVCPPDDEIDRGRVLITTRNSNVAKKAFTELYEPRFLNQEQSKMLLYKICFPKEKPPKDLDYAATEIAKKCRGLPLAIVVVGGRLYMEHRSSEWRKVADSIDWLRGDQECNQILASSYEDMKSDLKMCFMYLASFPEDYQIDAKSLIRTWVAEGLVSDEADAQKCLQELTQRCMVLVSKTAHDGSITKFWVHDLLLGLAIKEAREKKFMSVFAEQIPDRDFNDARRASIRSCSFRNERKLRREYNKKLRSLLVFDAWLDVEQSLPNDLLVFRLLKVLKVHGCSISFKKLENWCEELIHLRHLEFRNCIFESFKIPESIGHLKNLLTLDCTETTIIKLPESLWSIATLRHVLLTDDRVAKAAVAQPAGLPNLRTLWNVELEPPSTRPTDGRYNRYDHISNLHELGLLNVDPRVAALLKELSQLVALKINNGFKFLPPEVLDMRDFKFYQHLEYLFLSIWPKHVELRAHLLPPNLTKLCLTICFKKDPMPELEQLHNLAILILSYKSAFQDVFWVGEKSEDGNGNGDKKEIMTVTTTMTLTCSAGGFPTLRQLVLKDLPAEEFSVAPGAMLMLEQLLMNDFHRMRNIPELQHLTKLHEFEWTGAPYFDEEIQAMREENQHKLRHVSTVAIRSHCFKLSILG